MEEKKMVVAILSAPRCGNHYFGSLLESNGIYPLFELHSHFPYKGNRITGIRELKERIADLVAGHKRVSFSVFPEAIFSIFGRLSIPINQVSIYLFLKSVLPPETKFVQLYRKNRILQQVSSFYAFSVGNIEIPQGIDKEAAKEIILERPYDYDTIQSLHRFVQSSFSWNQMDHLLPIFPIAYEDLYVNPEESLLTLGGFLNYPLTTYKQKRFMRDAGYIKKHCALSEFICDTIEKFFGNEDPDTMRNVAIETISKFANLEGDLKDETKQQMSLVASTKNPFESV